MTTKIKSGLIADNAIVSAHISSGAISSAHLSSIDTDNVSEGSSNLYFTTARARTSLSVTDSGGDGSLAYSNGVITYTGPSASEVRAHLSAGTGVTYSSGEFSIGQSVATTASPTFADINVTGNINVTGDLNTVSVADLDVTDQTITLGAGQNEASSGGSGIVVDGSGASLLWDESNDEWDFNKSINVTGAITSNDRITGDGTEAAPAFRFATDTNTGMFPPSGGDVIGFATGGTERMRVNNSGIDVTGTVTATDLLIDTDVLVTDSTNDRVGINKTSPATTLDVGGSIYFSSILRGTSDGSESSPTIQPGLDADTGLYRPATNQIGFTTAGTNALTLDASQNATFAGTISSGAITTTGTFTGHNINLRNDTAVDGAIIRDISFLTSAAQGTDDRVAIIRASNQGGDGTNRGGKFTFYTRKSNNAGFNSTLVLDKDGNSTFAGAITASGDISIVESDNAKMIVNSVGDYFPSLQIKRTSGSSKSNYEWNFQLGSSGFLNLVDGTNSYYAAIFKNNGDVALSNDTDSTNPVLFLDKSTESATFAGTIDSGAINISGTSSLSTEFKIGNLTWNQNTSTTSGLLHQYRGSDGYSELQINNTSTSGAVVLNIRNASASVATIANNGNATFNGKVGIGTNNPTNAKAHIVGDGSYVGDYGYSTLVLEDASGYAGLNLRNGNNNWLMRNDGSNNSLQIVSSSNASGPGTGTYTPRLVIMQAGKVGIGETNPSYQLDILAPTNYRSILIGQAEATGTKRMAIAARHYDSSEQPHNLIGIFTDAADNSILTIGGGLGSTGNFNSVTDIELHTGTGTGTQTTAAMKINSSGNVGIGTNNPYSKLHVDGAVTSSNSDNDLLTHSHSSYASRVGSGRIDVTAGYSGTLASGRQFRFKYNAVSWKAYHGRITLSGTGGFASYEFGGYWNNSGGSQTEQIHDALNSSCSIANSGQAIIVTITIGQTVVHPCFSVEYNQSGGDGAPRMDRAEFFIQ
jgi:hypothetical protein